MQAAFLVYINKNGVSALAETPEISIKIRRKRLRCKEVREP